ncbi:MAG: hypothetical protein WBM36_06990 [Lysobacterales bacterium]
MVLPGRAYVQDERYAAGAGSAGTACVGFAGHLQTNDSLRGDALLRISNDAVCKPDEIAPHFHVLYRDIPFILNITPTSAGTEYIYQKPMAHDYAHSRGCAVHYFRTLSDMDVAPERTWMYLQRVLI